MKHISILVYEDVVLSTLTSAYTLLFSANQFFLQEGEAVSFTIELVGVNLKNIQLNLPVQFFCSRTINEKFSTDLIIVPPVSTFKTSLDSFLKKNNDVINWLQIKHGNGAEILSLCSGSYLVAEAGLLNGKEATSHWQCIEDMEKRYPEIIMMPDKIVTYSNGIYTGGGAYSSLNAVLYLIEKHFSKSVAVALSKEYAIDFGRNSQSVFTVFQGQRLHNDDTIHKAQDYIEMNFKNSISVESIAIFINMSKRNFIRRFKTATKNNPIEYIQKTKIEYAKKVLEIGNTSINAITYDVGYNDLKTFREVFKRITGLTPIEYRNKYNKAYD